MLAWQGDRIAAKLLDLRFGAVLAAPSYPAPRDATEARLQDLDYLDRLTEVDRSFSAEAAARFHQRIAALKARAAQLEPAQFLLGIAEAVAQADNAHTGVDPATWRTLLASAPVRLAWFDEGLFVTSAAAPYDGLRGARVSAIDGFDPARLEAEAARHLAGPAEHLRASSAALLESPDVLHAMHPEAPSDRLVLRAARPGDPERDVEVPAIAPQTAPNLDWRQARDPRLALPASLKGVGRSAYWEKMPGGVLYLHLWKIRGDASGPLAQSIAEALGTTADPTWRRIILDLRSNGGGEVPEVLASLKAMPARLAPGGKLVILQDETTFSAAMIATALAKSFAAGRAVVVGGKPGDRLTFWAEGNDIRLPNSGVRVTTSTGYHDWARGCRELRCYWPNFLYDVGVGNVDPDIGVRLRFEDYRMGKDTVLERALALP